MKKILILACMMALTTGCASEGVKKRFTVIVDPPDAQITIIPGAGQPEQKYSSPADIAVFIPNDRVEAAKGRLEIKREAYKPMTLSLLSIVGETLRLKLEKTGYRLKYRMLTPQPSDELRYRDKILDIRLIPGDRQFNLKIENLTNKPFKILWEKSEYIDYVNRQHRVIHAGVRPQDRNNAVPPQDIKAGETLTQAFIPASAVVYSQEKKVYETKLLFPIDNDSALLLKGKMFTLFLPLELDRAIIPDYNFRFEIVDVIKE